MLHVFKLFRGLGIINLPMSLMLLVINRDELTTNSNRHNFYKKQKQLNRVKILSITYFFVMILRHLINS